MSKTAPDPVTADLGMATVIKNVSALQVQAKLGVQLCKGFWLAAQDWSAINLASPQASF